MIRCEMKEASEKKAVEKYGFHRATYFRAKKRGYFCPAYHVKRHNLADKFDTSLAYKIASACARKYFPKHLMEDAIQEGVLEILLKAGNIKCDSKIFARLACQGMRNFVYSFSGRNGQKNTFSYQEGGEYYVGAESK